ncbi:MAG: hypothetical protein SPI06_11975 [Terrisporobacter sp.]|uniref:hypothetical protein n=1 Tax=Terrisporobacter sp. TaxID=1965305 RepID=UPI002A90AE59|nr:hypothetical protein [Terrisporobacter sp.]MDY6154115.1 hypothetical protein [Terrisporobacter sp.]
MSEINMNNITNDTKIRFKFGSGIGATMSINDLIANGKFGNDEEVIRAAVYGFLQTGKAVVIESKDPVQAVADKIAEELMAVETAKSIQEDHIERMNFGDTQYGMVKKCRFQCKTIIDATQALQMVMRNYNITKDHISINSDAEGVFLYLENIPQITYVKISKALTVRNVTEAVTNKVEKSANSIVNGGDILLNDVGVPISKVAIGTTAKIAKSILQLGVKLGSIAIGEFTKEGKNCIREIKEDGYLQVAKGEVIDAGHSIKRAINNRTNIVGCGEIIE